MKNFHIVLLTGRSISEIVNVPFLLEVLNPCYIAANGGIEIYKNQEGKYTPCSKFNNFIALQDSTQLFECEEFVKKNFPNLRFQEPYRQSQFKKSFYIREQDFENLKMISNFVKNKFINTEIILSFNRCEPHFLDIHHKKFTKFSALNFISNILNVSLDRIVFFGDNGNDISCFLALDNSYLFSHFVEKLKLFYDIKDVRKFIHDSPGPLSVLKKLNTMDFSRFE